MSNQFGISDTDLIKIISTIRTFKEIESVILFGSRAIGNFKSGSDIDLALYGKNISQIIFKLSGILENELSLPYQFDLIHITDNTSSELLEHIKKFGKEL